MTSTMDPKNIKVLIVDDMSNIRDFVRSQLRLMGFKEVVEAKDGYEAMLLLKAQKPEDISIELIIADWNMPRMNGLELLKEVRNHPDWSDIVFILLTGETDREQISEAIMSGISQYIVKPVAGKAFEEKIRATWDRQRSSHVKIKKTKNGT